MSEIEFCNVSTGYFLKRGKVKEVSNSLNMVLKPGRLTSLMGLNGTGKSTLIRTICGFTPPLKGEVLLNGRPMMEFNQAELASKIGVVLTDKTGAGGMSVSELVSLGRYPYTNFFGDLTRKDEEKVVESIAAVGMLDKKDSYVSELSDGERQKVMIAKALAQESDVIILDEPTAFLDLTSKIEVMILLKKMATDKNKTILLSTHDIELALSLSEDIWLMQKNQALISGSVTEIVENGRISQVFDRPGIGFDKKLGRFVIDIK